MCDILPPENLVSQGILDDHQAESPSPIGRVHLDYYVLVLGYLLDMTHGGQISAYRLDRYTILFG